MHAAPTTIDLYMATTVKSGYSVHSPTIIHPGEALPRGSYKSCMTETHRLCPAKNLGKKDDLLGPLMMALSRYNRSTELLCATSAGGVMDVRMCMCMVGGTKSRESREEEQG